ncbi:MAG: fluoride efflux transporter CrcB [Thermodesulfobacteriota bacterium]
MKILAILVGGGIGSLTRYGLFMLIQRPAGADFPMGTLAANLLGCLLIGFLWGSFETTRLANEWRLLIFTGFLGGLTTFSTIIWETIQLAQTGATRTALLYLGMSNTLGIALAVAGHGLARRLQPFGG